MEDNRHDYHHDHDVNAVQDTDKTKTIDQSKVCVPADSYWKVYVIQHSYQSSLV